MHHIIRLLATTGSIITIGFGAWHFFVPKIWNWYSYIDAGAPELVAAVRATNVFLSLSLVLFGTINILLIQLNYSNRLSIIIVLSASIVLWVTRVVFQIIYPQGTLDLRLQFGMLIAFSLVAILYLAALGLLLICKKVV